MGDHHISRIIQITFFYKNGHCDAISNKDMDTWIFKESNLAGVLFMVINYIGEPRYKVIHGLNIQELIENKVAFEDM